jgi:hypothetical protein
MDCVLYDYEGRVLVVASPSIKPKRLTFVDMNAPEQPVVTELAALPLTTLPGQFYLLKTPDAGLGVAFTLDSLDLNSSTKQYGAELNFVSMQAAAKDSALPLDRLKYLRVGGDVGGALEMTRNRVIVRGDPLEVAIGASGPRISQPLIGFDRPAYLKSRDPREGFQVVVADESRIVMVPSDAGVVDVLSKKTGEWRRIPVPFISSLMRGFGSWLAMIETQSSGATFPTGQSTVKREEIKVARESPGAEKRRRQEILPQYRNTPPMTIDDLFIHAHERGIYYSGELAVMNLDTGVQIKISTGSGDSEVVLVTDEDVYYRVDDTLYRSQIRGASLGAPSVVARGAEIAQVHWAFLD